MDTLSLELIILFLLGIIIVLVAIIFALQRQNKRTFKVGQMFSDILGIAVKELEETQLQKEK